MLDEVRGENATGYDVIELVFLAKFGKIIAFFGSCVHFYSCKIVWGELNRVSSSSVVKRYALKLAFISSYLRPKHRKQSAPYMEYPLKI